MLHKNSKHEKKKRIGMNEVQWYCSQSVRFLFKSILGFEGPLPTGMLYPDQFVLESKTRYRIQQPAEGSWRSTHQATAPGNLIGEIDCHPR